MKMHKLIELLIELEITSEDCLSVFHHGTRDIPSINVLRCERSGVLILDKINTDLNYEKNKAYDIENLGATYKRGKTLYKSPLLHDDLRRFNNLKGKLLKKDILDFGCRQGGFIKLASTVSNNIVGIELHYGNRKSLQDAGFDIKKTTDELKSNELFDVITLHHVFEHLSEPVEILTKLKKHLKPDGELIIEVPHSNDILIQTMDIPKFKSFTFWSEHLILHTKESLNKILEHVGFKTKEIVGFQRYPISNHLYWLHIGQGGGQDKYKFLNDKELIKSYNNFLVKKNLTDTIIGSFNHRHPKNN